MVDHGAQNREIMKFDRLTLGTVQFGMDYGIANTKGRLSKDEAHKLLLCAQERGVRTLDTAASYGDSEKCLGEIGIRAWEVVSKIPGLPSVTSKTEAYSWFDNSIQRSLKRLKINTLHGLLIHRPSDLLGPYGQTLYTLLSDTKKRGMAKKIGISVYSPSELEVLFDRYPIDMVQLPLNVFDQRFAESGWLTRLKQAGVEIHSRSVFLQGLLLMPADARPKQFFEWPDVWRRWDQWLQDTRISPLVACLNAALMREEIDRVVIGFDNLKQFEQLCETRLDPRISLPTFSDCVEEALINPSKWSAP